MAPTLLSRGTLKFGDEAEPRPGRAIDEILIWIRARLPELGRRGATLADRALVVQAETGTGKSTVLPVELFRALRSGAAVTPTSMTPTYSGKHVLCCQPRILTAVTLANEVSRSRLVDGKVVLLNPDIAMGKTVGYQTGTLRSRRLGGLIYATIGILAAQLRSATDAEIMSRYRAIVIDEAHERSVEADLTLLLLRDFYARNLGDERLPFIFFTSATFDPDQMAAFFGVGKSNIARVTGASFPVAEVWPDAAGVDALPDDYVEAAIATVRRIHEKHLDDDPERADVLVFAPGAAEIADIVEGLNSLNAEYVAAGAGAPAPLLVLAIDGPAVAAESAAHALAFAPPALLPAVGGRRPARRVIVATVVAETGLTIDTLKYVIDHGWSRTAESYPMWGWGGIVTRPAARSRVTQRRGRVGRLFPGEFYPLYDRDAFDALDAQQLPDVATKGIVDVYLMVVRAAARRARIAAGLPPGSVVGVSVEPADLGMPEAPPVAAVAQAHLVAAALGTIVRAPGGWALTPLGERLADFERVPLAAARVVLAGCAWRAAASDLLTAAALVSLADAPRMLTARESRSPSAGGRALLAALPPALGDARVPPAKLGPDDHREVLRTRLALADDFAEWVLIFDKFATRAGECRSAADFAALEHWCAECGLGYDAMLDFAARRDEIAAATIAVGIDPCRDDDRRLAVAPAATFGASLRALKRCLYDGLRHNLMRAAGTGSRPMYLSPAGVAVAWRPWERLRESAIAAGIDPATLPPPALALASAFALTAEAGVVRYSVVAPVVSVLDGFISINPGADRADRADRADDEAAPGAVGGAAGGAAGESSVDEFALDLY